MPTAHRVVSSVDCHHVRSNSIVLSGLDDGSPLCATSQSLPIETDASFGSGYEGIGGGAVSGGSTVPTDNTAPGSKVDLLGDPSLPSPLMKFRCVSGPVDYPLTRAYEERLLLARRRDRTPLPTEPRRGRASPSDSLNSRGGREIIGDMGGEDDPYPVPGLYHGARYRFPMSDDDAQHTDDDDQHSFVATTTGASCGRLSHYHSPHSATTPTSDTNGLFSRQRSYRLGGGLFSFSGDYSQELSSIVIPAYHK